MGQMYDSRFKMYDGNRFGNENLFKTGLTMDETSHAMDESAKWV
jgi:hypothetical protein